MSELNIEHLPKPLGEYEKAIKDALRCRGNFEYETIERLQELRLFFSLKAAAECLPRENSLRGIFKNTTCKTTHLPCGGCQPVCEHRREPEGEKALILEKAEEIVNRK